MEIFKFNTARLINHSCSQNCEVEGTGLKLWISAIKDIKKDDELTCDYGFSYDCDYKQFPCKCGKSIIVLDILLEKDPDGE